MSDFDSFGSSSSADGKGDKELQEFLMVEKQKAQFNAQVCSFNLFARRLLQLFDFLDT